MLGCPVARIDFLQLTPDFAGLLPLAQMAEGRREVAARQIGRRIERDPFLEERHRLVVLTVEKIGPAKEMQILLPVGRIRPYGLLDIGNGLLRFAVGKMNGASRIEGFGSMLQTRFGVEVEELNPFKTITWDAARLGGDAVEAAPVAAVAVGLGLRTVGDR